MPEIHTTDIRSKNMSLIKSKNTRPEILLRKSLHSRGYRYSLHNVKLPGRPDLFLKKYNAVIFVNGCFWHMHSCKKFSWPKSNTAFWQEKILANKARDDKVIQDLKTLNIRVLIVWQCSLGKKILDNTINEVEIWLKSNSCYKSIGIGQVDETL